MQFLRFEWKFLTHNLLKRKKILSVVFLSLIMTLSLLISIILAPSIFQRAIIQQKVEEYPYDLSIRIHPDTQHPSPKEVIDEWGDPDALNFINGFYEQVSDTVPEYRPINYRSFYQSPENQIPWNDFIANETESNTQAVLTNIIGIDPTYFTNPIVQKTMDDLGFSFNLLPTNSVYISENVLNFFPKIQDSFNLMGMHIDHCDSNGTIVNYTQKVFPTMEIASTIPDEIYYNSAFLRCFGLSLGQLSEHSVLIISNVADIYNLSKDLPYNYSEYSFDFEHEYFISMDRSNFDYSSHTAIVTQVEKDQKFIENVLEYKYDLVRVYIIWKDDLYKVKETLISLTVLLTIFSIPLLLFIFFLFRQIYQEYLVSDSLQIRNLQTIGMRNKKIKRLLLLEAGIIGLFAGIIGSGLSLIISQRFLNAIFQYYLPMSESTLTTTFSGGLVQYSFKNLILGISLGIGLALLIVHIALRRKKKKKQGDILRTPQYLDFKNTKIRRKLIIYASFFGLAGLFSLIFGILYKSDITIFRIGDLLLYSPFSGIVTIIGLFFLFLTPIVVILSIFRLIQLGGPFLAHSKLKSIFSLEKRFKARYNSQNHAHRRSWASSFSFSKILGENNPSKGFLTTTALVFTVLLFFSTIIQAESNVIDRNEIYSKANGDQYLKLKINSDVVSYQSFSSYMSHSYSPLGFSKINLHITFDFENTFCTFLENDSHFKEDPEFTMVSTSILSDIPLPDQWFDDINADQALSALQTPNTVLIPSNLKSDLGLAQGDNITWHCRDVNNQSVQVNLTVGGFYSCFPLTTISFDTQNNIANPLTFLLGDRTELPNLKIQYLEIVGYSSDADDWPNQQDVLSEVGYYFPNLVFLSDSFMPIEQVGFFHPFSPAEYNTYATILQFLDLELNYFLVYIGLMLSFQCYLYIHNQKHDFAIMTSKGVTKKQIAQTLFWETSGILVVSLFLSLVGFIGGALLDQAINYLSQIPRYFFRWPTLWYRDLWFRILIMIGFLAGSILTFSYFKIRKLSDKVTLIQELKEVS